MLVHANALSCVGGFAAFVLVLAVGLVLDSWMLREYVMRLAEEAVDHAHNEQARRRGVELQAAIDRWNEFEAETANAQAFELVDVIDSVGDEISVFECSGCDRCFIRNQPGYVKIGEGFEFCSAQCRHDPLPFPSYAPPARTLNASLN